MSDLVHADPLPAEQQNGQLTHVPGAIEAFARIMAQRELSRQQDLEREKRLAPIIARLREECPQIFRTDSEMAEIRASLASPNDEGKAS